MQNASPATFPTPSPVADDPGEVGADGSTSGRRRGRLKLAERLSARTLLLGGVMIVILALFTAAEQDPDFWWHLRIGRWMSDNGRLPSVDIFTYTVSSHAWTDHEYLTEILMWLTYSTVGIAALCIAFALLTWAGFWLLYLQVRRQPFVFVGVGLTIAAIAGSPIWGPRAQMITFALSCLELYWLRSYLGGRSLTITYFPLVMVAWANLHGGWVIGFAWLGVAIVAELVSWAWDQDNPAHRMHVKRLAVIAVVSGLAVAATPHFLSLYPYPFQTQGSVAQQKLIVEWFSPDFHLVELRPFEAMILLVVVGFALKRPSLYDVLLALVGIALALQSVRNVPLFVAAATPILIASYGGWWKDLVAVRKWTYTLPPRPLFAVVTAVALVVILAATSARIATTLSPARQAQLDTSTYPVAAADWLAAHPEVGTRMFNQYGWGGYLANRFYPEQNRRVFIFGEAALMGDPLLNEYEDVVSLRSDWQDVLNKYRVDYVVYNKGDALANVLSTQPDWKLVYQDRVAVIYVRAA